MTETWDCTQARPSLGVYVLGIIDPAERGLTNAHLATCEDCKDELAGLAALPELLASVDPADVSRICAAAAPAGPLPGPVRALPGTVRPRRRWRFVLAAAAAVVIASGLSAGIRAATSPARTVLVPVPAAAASWRTVHGTSQVTGVSATVAYSAQLWGDAFEVLVSHIPIGVTCELWVIHPDGTRTEVAAWTTARDEGRVGYPGSMPGAAGRVGKFEIIAGNKTLVEITPD